ncbi:MarR family transcriptional regulator [Brachyspira pilosicoli]|uniref:MarR family transcriptional regulator n=4 Tax=Brachyspira pilosicoli TaxID=52584 RepID=A0AAJ6KBP2_BRAPL|nr:MarR family transcriptional regulator [Brachyspira pilosicoli]AFR71411.1 putative transcriptional regulator [Brachyspira pilosicoli B2904]AGA67473.1 putative transcriptional regulator [Brachyspira pilosicoli P43/6/78]MBW5378012.1 MarR family transcriptional regulator [Brachyspira pilosicoli]MBW5382033.1 MarR family transcriptional regulator [Brachyspira pilosicoli]MBW5391332.1 MarR family transcriptional regulator [Brachyspira pilosicoli]
MYKEFIIINNIGYDICYTARKIYQYIGKQIINFDITPEQLIVLKELAKEEGISQKELSIRLDKDQNTVKAMIDKLEVKSFIKRKENKLDKRAFSLYLTEKAKKELPIIENYENQVLDTIVKELNPNDAEIIKNTLKKIRSNISEI